MKMTLTRLLVVAVSVAAFAGQTTDSYAACGVPSARAEFETPEVQAYARGARLLACHRATGREREVGVRANDGMGTDESSYVTGVVGRRWVWTSLYATFAESADVREDTLTDLRTGQTRSINVEDEDTDDEALALPGVLVTAGGGGVVVHHLDGAEQRLSAAPASNLAAAGARLYWSEGTVARTAVLALPAADAPRAKPLARTVGKCKPRPGARLLVRDGRLVVSRAGGATWACRGSKQRRVADSAAVFALTERVLLYPGGAFDVASGRRRALTGAEAATDGTVAYWLDAAATPQRTDF